MVGSAGAGGVGAMRIIVRGWLSWRGFGDFVASAEEGNSVVPAAPSLRPAAARNPP